MKRITLSVGVAVILVALLAISAPFAARWLAGDQPASHETVVSPVVQAAAAADPAVAPQASQPAQAAAVAAAAPPAQVASARVAQPAPSSPAQQVQPPTATISVVGEGTVTAKPDVAFVGLGVTVENRSLAQAQAQASQQMNAIIDQLTGMGVSKDDIQTINYSVSPVYDYPGDGRSPVLRGFQVSNQVSVKIRNIEKAGDLLDAVVNAGATNINSLSFGVDNLQPAKDQARDQAMADAKRKAEQMANAAGVSLGKPLSISSSDSTGQPPQPVREVSAAPAAAGAPPPIQPGTTDVSTTVNITYLIQ